MREKQIGKHIVFEGQDGCGKGEQVKKLVQYFRENSVPFLATREHTRETPTGRLIEDALYKRIDLTNSELQTLFTLDGEIHTRTIIKPTLDEGKIVVSDRWRDSTIAFGGETEERFEYLRYVQFPIKAIAPADVTIFIDTRSEVNMERIAKRGETKTIFEEVQSFQEGVRSRYLKLAELDPSYVVVNGNGSIEEVHKEILSNLFGRRIIA